MTIQVCGIYDDLLYPLDIRNEIISTLIEKYMGQSLHIVFY